MAAWDTRIRAGNLAVGSHTFELTDLSVGTQYFYRSYEFSLAGGANWSPESATFMTTPPGIPTLVADAIQPVGATSIVVSGTVTDNGGQTPEVTVYYGDNDGVDAVDQWDTKIELGPSDAEFSSRLLGLTPGTNYFYRVAAENVGGIGWSETFAFATPNAPPVRISELSAAGGTELTTRIRSSAEREFDGEPLITDWIEIENTTSEPIDIAGYTLTDRKNLPSKWTLPEGSIIPAHDVFLVFASGFDMSDLSLDEHGAPHTSFRLSRQGEYLGLYDQTGTVVSEFTDEFPAHLPGFTVGFFGDQLNYFDPGSPQATNFPGQPNIASLPSVSIDTKTFTEPFTVEFSTEQTDGEIRYTIDGEVPTHESILYEGPIEITESSEFRIRSFADGHAGSEIVSKSYVFLAENTANFTSDLPIILVDNFGRRRPSKSRQVNFQMLVFDVDPETGISAIAQEPDMRLRAGIKVRGQSSSNDPKTPYRFEVRDEYDQDENVSLLGLPSESDWVLHGPWSDRTLLHNSLAYEMAREMGIEGPRTQLVEVFRNQRTGPMEDEDYLGVYVLTESIKAGENRLDIADLDPNDLTEPAIDGGYILRFEQNVSEASDRLEGWRHLELFDAQKYHPDQKEWITNYVNQVDAVIERAETDRSYEDLIDVDSMVNMLVISELGRDQDAYVRSHYYHKDRGGKLVSGPIWDFNLIWNRGCCFDNRNTQGWQFDQDRPGSPQAWNKGDHNWNGELMQSHAFAQRLIDRWAELREEGNVLSLSSIFARIDAHVEEVRNAAERNYERWPDQLTSSSGFGGPRFPTHQEHIDDMKDWIGKRVEWIDSQFRAPPVIGLNGSTLSFLAVKDTEQIYFTTNGADPFDDDTGEPNASAQLYTQPVEIAEGTRVVARVRDTSVSPSRTELTRVQWSAPAASGDPNPFDLNVDGLMDIADVDLLCSTIRDAGTNGRFDLVSDGTIDLNDMDALITIGFETTFGDANLDGIFNSSDLVQVFDAAKFEGGVESNSTWAEGDWNCNGETSSRDFVWAFQFGGYVAAATSVPGGAAIFQPDSSRELGVELAASRLSERLATDESGMELDLQVRSNENAMRTQTERPIPRLSNAQHYDLVFQSLDRDFEISSDRELDERQIKI